MKIVTIVGARPQFIKAAPISKALQDAGHIEYMVHTGQHYDHAMSQVFFEELAIPAPHENLAVGSGLHGQQTGQMLARIESTLMRERPDWIVVFGDTNSTLAGALAAAKLSIPCAHVEAGLRSHRRDMPEEINRIVADHCAQLLFAPTQAAMGLLAREGLADRAVLVGDVMYDAMLMFSERADRSDVASRLGLTKGGYLVATIHRASTTDDPKRLREIMETLDRVAGEVAPVLLPLHPRTKRAVQNLGICTRHVRVVEPLSYLEMLSALRGCRAVLTDSGGVQKEAYFAGKLCFTLRDETEWTETVEVGANVLCGTGQAKILAAVLAIDRLESTATFGRPLYGDGNAAMKVVGALRGLDDRKMAGSKCPSLLSTSCDVSVKGGNTAASGVRR